MQGSRCTPRWSLLCRNLHTVQRHLHSNRGGLTVSANNQQAWAEMSLLRLREFHRHLPPLCTSSLRQHHRRLHHGRGQLSRGEMQMQHHHGLQECRLTSLGRLRRLRWITRQARRGRL